MSVLEYTAENHVGLVTLNRHEARNSMNPELIVRLAELWTRLKEDESVRSIVLTGAGDSTFCSGFELGTTIPVITGSRQPMELSCPLNLQQEYVSKEHTLGYLDKDQTNMKWLRDAKDYLWHQ